jgi:hypothetical protein
MKIPIRRLILTTVALLGAVFTLGLLSPAEAQILWTGTGGDNKWENSKNWNKVPASGDTAIIANANGSSDYYTGTALIDSGSYSINELRIGLGAAPNVANGWLQVTSGTLQASGLIEIGINSSGIGTLVVGVDGFVSSGPSTNKFIVGSNGGQGTLLLNGGRVQAENFILADGAASKSTVEINSALSTITKRDGNATTIVSSSGTGTLKFTHDGNLNFANTVTGTDVQQGISRIAISHEGTGTTTLTSGTVNVSNFSVTGGELSVSASTKLTVYNQVATVGNGATLSGSGTMGMGGLNPTVASGSSFLTIQGGGHLATTLKLGVGLTLNAGAVLDYTDGAALNITGGALKVLGEAGTVLVDFSSATLEVGSSYVIMNYAAISGNTVEIYASQFNTTGLDGVQGNFTLANNQLNFEVTVVPEPSAYFLMGIGLGLVGLLKLRRRRLQG